jgi:two-component system CheB/CheR fusion protein
MSARELEVQDKQGHWYLLRVRPYRTMENKIDGALLVLVDVDSLKRNEELLRQQTELLNQAHEPILMWYLDGGITYWNKAAEEAYGFTRDQALGRGSHDLLHTSPPYAELKPVIERHRYWTGELVHTRRDGQKIIVESRMVVVRDPGGRDVVVEAIRPISERKETERILRRRADDLVTADRHKDEFLAMLAHELRGPLAPLRNVVTLLRADSVKPGDKERMLQVMDRQIHTMARLIDDLLDVSRMTLSQITLRTQPSELAEILRRGTEQNEPAVQAKQQRLHLSLPLEPVHVLGDPIRLEQIVSNLVSNASKYTPEGGEIWVTLALEISADGSREAVVVVKDSGIGIDADKLPHVFDLFMRATRAIDQKYGGLGVGLTLVRRLTELHGGTVYAHSDGEGKGSTFTVRLPALPQRVDAEPSRVESAQKRNGSRRVLVVDDSSDHADTLRILLSEAGHTARTARSGTEALEVAAEFRPEVAILDIGMPEMDGCELARQLKALADSEQCRLIALSGYGQADVRQRALDAGFEEYLVKPIEARKILDLLET